MVDTHGVAQLMGNGMLQYLGLRVTVIRITDRKFHHWLTIGVFDIGGIEWG